MKVLIIEDEELAAIKLKKTLLDIDKTIEIEGIEESIESAVNWLYENPAPDLILMDIELQDGQSFEIFNRIEVKSPVIFTTSYDEYALKAFKVNSIDYLLKPIQEEELKAALDKFEQIKSRYSGEDGSPLNTLVRELQQKLQTKEYRKRFLVKQGQKLVSVEIEDIAYFFSEGRLNFFKTFDNFKYVVDYTMDELEEMLEPNQFFRISRAFFISAASADQINEYYGNRLSILLKPRLDKDVVVSRERVPAFKRWMGK
jgi:two-component system, LytTR family, response regulator LytT